MSFLLSLAAKHRKNLLLLCLFLVSIATSYWYGTTRAQVQIVEKEKIVTQTVTQVADNKEQQQKQDVNQVTHIVERPDGTKETTITQNTHTDTDSKEQTDTTTQTKSVTTESKTTTPEPPSKYHVGVYASTPLPDLFTSDRKLEYNAMVGRRVLGPFWVDGTYNFNKKDVGLGVSFEF